MDECYFTQARAHQFVYDTERLNPLLINQSLYDACHEIIRLNELVAELQNTHAQSEGESSVDETGPYCPNCFSGMELRCPNCDPGSVERD